MTISRATQKDLPRILEIQKEAYQSEAVLYGNPDIPPLRQALSDLETEYAGKVFLKAEEGGLIVGSVRLELSETVCRLGKLIVAPSFQNRGLGAALLNASESIFPEAGRMELFTGSRSEKNLQFYARRGYSEFRRERLSETLTLVYLRKQLST
jgi:N-acetylglutamate synthase-like GNAT family acetyltransferase